MRWKVNRHQPVILQVNRTDRPLAPTIARTERSLNTPSLAVTLGDEIQIVVSRSVSASSRFKRAFSPSRDLSSLASCLVMPSHSCVRHPNWPWRRLCCQAVTWVAWLLTLSFSACRSLSMICSGVCFGASFVHNVWLPCLKGGCVRLYKMVAAFSAASTNHT